MADLVVEKDQRHDNIIADVVGPDIFTFEELVRLIADILHRRVLLPHVHPRLACALAKLIEPMVGDVLITGDEVEGLMANLLISSARPASVTHLRNWLEQHAEQIGAHYASELQRHYRLTS